MKQANNPLLQIDTERSNENQPQQKLKEIIILERMLTSVARDFPSCRGNSPSPHGGCWQLQCLGTSLPRDCCYLDHAWRLSVFILACVSTRSWLPSWHGTVLPVCSVLLGGSADWWAITGHVKGTAAQGFSQALCFLQNPSQANLARAGIVPTLRSWAWWKWSARRETTVV